MAIEEPLLASIGLATFPLNVKCRSSLPKALLQKPLCTNKICYTCLQAFLYYPNHVNLQHCHARPVHQSLLSENAVSFVITLRTK